MTATIDPLIVDTYVGDKKDSEIRPAVEALINAGPPWHGLVHKLTQGTYHDESARVLMFRDAITSHARYGVDFWDGYYHFLDLNQDGAEQADFFWARMEKIGGEKAGTLWPMVDVERGGQRRIPNASDVFDCVRAFADRVTALGGRKPTLYAGELLRSLGIHHVGQAPELLGCGRSAIALYAGTLPGSVVVNTGTDYPHLFLWQYDGDGESYLQGYPATAPGFGKIDISAMVLPGGLDAMRSQLAVRTPAAKV